MSVESAWDVELAHAGEMLEHERQRYIQQAHELGREVERLRAENGRMRAENDIWMQRAHNAEEALDRLNVLADTIRAKQANRYKADL